jgi:hypothetical protein
MRRRFAVVLGGILVGVMLAGLFSGGDWALAGEKQKKKVKVETKAAMKDKREFPDQPEAKNTQQGTSIAQRKGPNSCDVMFSNNTSWWIHRVYVDGQFVGKMAPHGEYILRDVLSGSTKLYAEADFTDGSVRYWGPRTFDCPSYTEYTWTLHP